MSYEEFTWSTILARHHSRALLLAIFIGHVPMSGSKDKSYIEHGSFCAYLEVAGRRVPGICLLRRALQVFSPP